MKLKRTIAVSLITGQEIEFIERVADDMVAGEADRMHRRTVRRVLFGPRSSAHQISL